LRMVDLFTDKTPGVDGSWENRKLWFNPGEL
jgi:hypothetical protein